MTVREVHLVIGKHEEGGTILLLESLEDVARDTNTQPSEWTVHDGWVEIGLARHLSPTIEEAILQGRLKIRDVPEGTEGEEA